MGVELEWMWHAAMNVLMIPYRLIILAYLYLVGRYPFFYLVSNHPQHFLQPFHLSSTLMNHEYHDHLAKRVL
jgi:hypothetical protein